LLAKGFVENGASDQAFEIRAHRNLLSAMVVWRSGTRGDRTALLAPLYHIKKERLHTPYLGSTPAVI
jgi:hypothetical protein